MPIREWQKSSYCQEGEACLHIATHERTVLLTESADPSHAVLSTAPTAMAALLLHIKAQAITA